MKIIFLLVAFTGHLYAAETLYDQGNISFRETGKYSAQISLKKPVPPTELTTLVHLHMAKTCGKNFLFLDSFQPGATSAKLKFHCQKNPDYFQGDARMQALMIRDLCAQNGPRQPEYLKKLCAESAN